MNEGEKRLAAEWESCGVVSGDLLLVHSSLKRTVSRLRSDGLQVNANTVLDSLCLAIGDSGTLILPLFNFDFPKGVTFDMRYSPSQMGALTEAARLRDNAVRTGHPIYSFAAIGRIADLFRGVNNESGYGADSPFAMLRDLGGKIAVIDLPDQNSMTFYHHVEEMCTVDYRYFKTFRGPYIDLDGRTSERAYRLFVRDIERGVLTSVDRAGELLWSEGLYSGSRPGVGPGMRTVSAQKLFARIESIIKAGEAANYLYEVEV